MNKHRILHIALLLGLAGVTGTAAAGSIIIENAGIEVPLRVGSSVVMSVNGDVTAECQSNGNGGCLGLPNPNGVAVTLTSNFTVIGTGQSVTVTWDPDDGAEACRAFATPAVSNWSGLKAAAGGSQQLTFPTSGSYSLFIQCYDDNGSAGAVSRGIQVN